MIVNDNPAPESGGDLRDVFKAVRAFKFTVAAFVVAFGLAGLAGIVLSPPRWTAEAVVALEARKVQIAPSDAVVSRLPSESPVLRSELDFITSRSMAENVLDHLGPEWEPILAAQDWHESTASRLRKFVRALIHGPQMEEADKRPDRIRMDAVSGLLSGLIASNDGRSLTIFLTYSASDPQAAAKIANAYAEAYVQHQVEVQRAATMKATEWLASRIDGLRDRLATAEAAVEEQRQRSALVDPSGSTLQERRLSALNSELAAARSARAEADARLQSAREEFERNGTPVSEAMNSPTVQALRRNEAELRRSILELEGTGASKSERLLTLRTSLEALHQQIGEETSWIMKGLDGVARSAARKQNDLEEALSRLELEVAEADKARAVLQRLEREASASRGIYESFLTRYKQTIEQEGLAVPEAKLLSAAEPPGAPSGPKVAPTLAIALLAGLLGGTGTAFLRYRIDGKVRSEAMLEAVAQAPVIGRLPGHWRHTPEGACIDAPNSLMARALHKLQTALRYSNRTRGAHVVAITSALHGEGRTSVCVALARSLALSGVKVVVVDADLRRPRIAAQFGQAIGRGIQNDPLTDARYTHVSQAQGVSDLGVRSQAFQALIQQLKKENDIVLVDTPPLSEFGDGAYVGSCADVTLLVVRWGSTTYDAVAAAANELDLCGARLGGLVLTRTDSQARLRQPLSVSLKRTQYRNRENSRVGHGTALPARHSSEGLDIVHSSPSLQTDA